MLSYLVKFVNIMLISLEIMSNKHIIAIINNNSDNKRGKYMAKLVGMCKQSSNRMQAKYYNCG